MHNFILVAPVGPFPSAEAARAQFPQPGVQLLPDPTDAYNVETGAIAEVAAVDRTQGTASVAKSPREDRKKVRCKECGKGRPDVSFSRRTFRSGMSDPRRRGWCEDCVKKVTSGRAEGAVKKCVLKPNAAYAKTKLQQETVPPAKCTLLPNPMFRNSAGVGKQHRQGGWQSSKKVRKEGGKRWR